MSNAISLKQEQYIIDLSNRLHDGSARHLSQTPEHRALGMAKKNRGLTKADASSMIDDLLAELASIEEAA